MVQFYSVDAKGLKSVVSHGTVLDPIAEITDFYDQLIKNHNFRDFHNIMTKFTTLSWIDHLVFMERQAAAEKFLYFNSKYVLLGSIFIAL